MAEEAALYDELCETIHDAVTRGETVLNISSRDALRTVPEDLKLLKGSLGVLHIDNNYQLYQLPPCIGDLHKLTWLNVSYNRLTELPPEIGRLRALTRLHCNNNLLKGLPIEIWNLKELEELQVDSNQITALPTGVLEMPKLAKLFVDNNPLLKRDDLAEGLEEKVPPPPAVGDCSLTHQKFTQCFIHVSFHTLGGVPEVPVVHYLASVNALQLMKTVLLDKYGVAS
eukprot:TRINITY_DN14223_c0_g1_i1.p1 TRINITY_DN14223_c0_g1~~TRINITY_DN14223_c0_g1_i1.p1  ORF type:complete len:243 (-),score=107.33 TRINITY_DN14223_c0_g1_i1:225-905(-)